MQCEGRKKIHTLAQLGIRELVLACQMGLQSLVRTVYLWG